MSESAQVGADAGPAAEQAAGRQLTSRQRSKADRRTALLASAKRLMAKHGYSNVRLEDIGGAAGVSGPAVYRHFAGKEAVLAELMVGISHRLLEEGRRIHDEAATPVEALRGLIGWQLDFALTEPELILIYDRDRFHLPEAEFHEVRRTQRTYVEIWVQAITAAAPAGDEGLDRTRAHAVIGLINSTPRSPRTVTPAQTRAVVMEMALGALGLGALGLGALGLGGA